MLSAKKILNIIICLKKMCYWFEKNIMNARVYRDFFKYK